MGKGFLQIQTVTANGAVLVGDVSITIADENNQVIYELSTDETGNAPEIALEAPDRRHMEDPEAPGPRFGVYSLLARAPGYTAAEYEGVMIFDTTTSILKIEMDPLVLGQEQAVKRVNIGGHKLYETEAPQQVQEPETEDGFIGIAPRILPEVTIPNFIRVHLGRMETPSAVVSVPFMEYVKNMRYTKRQTT